MIFRIKSHFTRIRTEVLILESEEHKNMEVVFNQGMKCWVGKDSISSDIEVFEEVLRTEETIELEKVESFVTDNGYIKIKTKNDREEFLHRVVVFSFGDKNGNYQNNFVFQTEIDHVDGNKLRNIPENLEIVPPIVNKYRAYSKNYKDSDQYFFDSLKKMNIIEFNQAISFLNEEIKKEGGKKWVQ